MRKNRFLHGVYWDKPNEGAGGGAPNDRTENGTPASNRQWPKSLPLKLLLTVEETMAETGFSRTVLYRKFKSGEILALKVGARTYIRSADLIDYIAGLPSLHSNEAPGTARRNAQGAE